MNKAAPIRDDIQARFPDGRAFNGPVGTTVEAFMATARPEVKGEIVAALVNGRLRALSVGLVRDAELVPVTTADSDGGRIYRRSLSFLMIAAAAELFPRRTITIQHSMPFGGYYCELADKGWLDADELGRLKQRMRELVDADHPIQQVQVPLAEALEKQGFRVFLRKTGPDRFETFLCRPPAELERPTDAGWGAPD